MGRDGVGGCFWVGGHKWEGNGKMTNSQYQHMDKITISMEISRKPQKSTKNSYPVSVKIRKIAFKSCHRHD